jgi:hypothetical protein
MNNHVIKLFVAGGFIVLSAVVLAGCATCKPGKPGKVGQYAIEVSLDESLKTSSVIVDLIGVNPSSLPRWEAYDMTKYWREGDAMRRDADKRNAKLAITNDQRAAALGYYFDVNGVLRMPKRKNADQKSGAVRTSWPARSAR